MTIDVNAYLGHFAFRQLRHNTAAALVKLMDRKGIHRAAVSNAACITYRNAQPGNEALAAEIEPYRERFAAVAVLNPAYAGWRDDLEACRRLGFKALRLYPRWHHYKLTDAACRDLAEAAADHGLPLTIPIRVEDRRQQSWLVDVPDVDLGEIAALVKAVPRARFIVSNGAGFTSSELGRKGNDLPPNYAIDTSRLSAVMNNELGQLAANLGAERIVFGTGMPFHYPDAALVNLEVLKAPDEVKEAIRAKNAARLLGL
ncbi:MAG: amidohydrolase family protein [Bryobacteraceae bacterium]|nr:amidohydrolase family protein [Bryobacteraceae bacterium]